MSISIELPAPLEAELAIEARREGLTVAEEATFLLCLATALLDQAAETPFRNSVRSVLESHEIDTGRVASALEQLKKSSEWRNSLAHRPVGATQSVDRLTSPAHGSERPSILGKYAYLGGGTEEFMREKQEELDREERR